MTRKTLLQQREYLQILRRLQNDGVNVNIPDNLIQRLRPLDIFIAAPPASYAYEISGPRLAYAIFVQLCARQPCIVTACDIDVPGDEIVLEDIDMWNSLPFSGDEALNARLERGLTFHRSGDVIQGFIFATGLIPPRTLATDGWLSLTVSLFDIYGESSSARQDVFVQANRSQTRVVAAEQGHICPPCAQPAHSRLSTADLNSDSLLPNLGERSYANNAARPITEERKPALR